MSRTSIGILIGLALAVTAAAQFEGTLSTGLIAGYLFGASIGLCSVAWQQHVIRHHPERAMAAQMQGFLMKLSGLALSGVCVRFLEPVASVAHWKSFILAYACAALLALILGSFDNARSLRSAGHPGGPALHSNTPGEHTPGDPWTKGESAL